MYGGCPSRNVPKLPAACQTIEQIANRLSVPIANPDAVHFTGVHRCLGSHVGYVIADTLLACGSIFVGKLVKIWFEPGMLDRHAT